MAFETEDELFAFFRLPADHPLAPVDEAMETWASSQGGGISKGYPSTCGTCRGARSSVQFDDADDVIDERQRSLVINAVDGAMDSLSDPWLRAVLWQVYTNRRGPAIWRLGVTAGMGKGQIRELWLAGLTEMRALLRRRAVAV